jgi:hypothetical protein
MKVDELRQLARQAGIGGVSSMRKDDLVNALTKARRRAGGGRRNADGGARDASRGGGRNADGVRTGGQQSKSIKYAQEVTSPEDEPVREGRSLVTTNHDVIRRWAEERGAVPATVEGTEHDGHLGVLTFDFPGGTSGGRLRHVSWDEWFKTFDERRLNFIYQEQRADGRQSSFFRIENPEREDA